MKGLCSYCSRYFFVAKDPNKNEEDVILCSSFTQNNDNEETIWEQRRYEIAKDVVAGLVQRPNSTYDSVVNSAIKIADKLIERLKEKQVIIDDKKIEEAAQGAADLYEQDLPIMSYNEDTEVDGQHHFCQEFGAELFKDGAKWAINEFLKNL